MKIEIKKTNIKDLDFLFDNLRDCDRQEILQNLRNESFQEHIKKYKALPLENVYSVFIANKLVCVFGTSKTKYGCAYVWMLSTKYLSKFNKTFLKNTPDIRKIAFDNNIKLFNFVYTKNKSAIRYLEYVGAVFKNVFSKDKKFQYFEIVRN